jgi:GNAT superfamily N-acetyltransferase
VNSDVNGLLELEDEENRYLSESPVFLKKRNPTGEEMLQNISQKGVFVARHNDRLIGVMTLDLDQGYHIERLTTLESGYIGRPGAYVKPEYQRRGVATGLLQELQNFALQNGKPFIHVSFETANPAAGAFWPKHFKPVIRSVRRTINKDSGR